MEQTNTQTGEALTMGPIAEGLLLAMRHVEAARNELYTAVEKEIGEEYTEARIEREAPAWDAVCKIINDALMEHATNWAVSKPQTNTF